MEFQFVDELPQPKGGRGANQLYEAFAEALKQRPGQWALFPVEHKDKTAAASRASNIKHGKYKSFPAGQFAASVRGLQVFARYVAD